MDVFFDSLFPAGPPSLGLDKRSGTLDAGAVRRILAEAARAGGPLARAGGEGFKAPSPERLRLLEGVALLWNDCWDQAHGIAQSREGERDFDTLHAMLHRREGDYANAGYWFRAAGKHPCYPRLERRIADFLDGETAGALLPEGHWSPDAFLDRVRKRSQASAETARSLARAQAEEFLAFAEWLVSP